MLISTYTFERKKSSIICNTFKKYIYHNFFWPVLKIWDLSDPTAKGFLTKQGFFVALKLIALAQAGRDISMLNITQQTIPPNMVQSNNLLDVYK